MKMIRKILISVLLLLSASVFADQWFVCLGSYKSLDNAEECLQNLCSKNVPAFLDVSEKDGVKSYRILFAESFETKEKAILHRDLLSQNSEVKKLNISGAWCYLKTEEAEIVYSPEVMEKRTLIIKDSDTGAPVALAVLFIDQTWNSETDETGMAILPSQVGNGEHSVLITKGNEYVPTTSNFTVADDVITSVPQMAIPKKVDYERIKIVLDWGYSPYDLDSHIFRNDGSHVYYSRRRASNMDLDRDDTDSYGPETVTIRDFIPDAKYEYYVYNYSDGGYYDSSRLSNSNATVRVTFNNESIAEFHVRPEQTGLVWHVFDIVNNQIVPVDTVSNDNVYRMRE